MSDLDDRALVDAILAGDRAALGRLVAREHSWLVRVARAVARDDALAEEIVQDAWIRVIRSLRSFEGRSSLRSWMATIVLNRAKTAVVRGARMIPVASLALEPADDEEVVDRSRFGAIGFWSDGPDDWKETSAQALLERREVRSAVEDALRDLPPNQRAVLTLRDLEGWSSDEVRDALDLSESNQRVLLHRARAKVRAALDDLFRREPAA